ncbi:MAG: phosphoribosylamine--glycine ligase [Thermodesulfovibrionales bacterium]|nr:phosphoribosylamine--glycine ligase [Thermodesulfovibrionales bacterium]
MKALLVGGGAREHAIADALFRSGAELIVAMYNQNPGILKISKEWLQCNETEINRIAHWACEKKADFAVIGLEDPLDAGISDELLKHGIPSVGPQKNAAKLEMSKLFTRNLMQKYNIPGQVQFHLVSEVDELKKIILASDEEFVLKPIGLTAGKGVKIMGEQLLTKEDAIKYGQLVIEQAIGKSNSIMLEEKLEGEEFTLQCFVDGTHVAPMPAVQDHKRAFAGDVGPNTGGMGSYSQADGLLPFLSAKEYRESLRIIEQVVLAVKREGYEYKGILYGQFMLTGRGLRVIEFNARFGDPECMNVLPLLKNNFIDVCWHIINGSLDKANIEFMKKATVCKYIVPKGYGVNPLIDKELMVDEAGVDNSGGRLYYAKINEKKGKLLTTKSRSIGILGIADTIEEAEIICENALSFVRGDFDVRHDIGKKALLDRRVKHMEEIRKGMLRSSHLSQQIASSQFYALS